MNITLVNGFLGADAEYKTNKDPSKNTVRLPVYNNYRDGGESRTEVVTCTAWGRMADSIASQMQHGKFLKGCAVTVAGAMHMHEYVPTKGKNAGQKVCQLQIARLDQAESQVQTGWQESNMAAQQTMTSQNIPQQAVPQNIPMQNMPPQNFQQAAPQQAVQQQPYNAAPQNAAPNYGVYYEMPVYGNPGTENTERNEELPGGFRKASNQIPYNYGR